MKTTSNNSKQRRLISKTIVFTDLVGSTNWLEKVGPEVAYDRLVQHYVLLEREFKKSNGSIVKRNGDGVMAVFDSVQEAIQGSIRTQQQLIANISDANTEPLFPELRIAISSGPLLPLEGDSEIGKDYLARACAIAKRILDITQGAHILVDNAALVHEDTCRSNLLSQGVHFTAPTEVRLKSLPPVSVVDVLYNIGSVGTVIRDTVCVDTNGFLQPQSISISDHTLRPFDNFKNSSDAANSVYEFLKRSTKIDFLHNRGIVQGSNSPFNIFVNLLDRSSRGTVYDNVRVVMLNPDSGRFYNYYVHERKLSPEWAISKVNECKAAVNLVENKLNRFKFDKKIKHWEIVLHDQLPIWRMAISDVGLIFTPYGEGSERTDDNLVQIYRTVGDSVYNSHLRYFESVYKVSRQYIKP